MAGALAEEASHIGNVHEFYLQILNTVSDVVYWVDMNCHLKGCNKAFVELLDAKNIPDISGLPYDLLTKYAGWSLDRVEALKLDDMSVIFSGEAKRNANEPVIYNKDKEPLYFSAIRTPLYDGQKHICGLVVVLVNVNAQKELEQKLKTKDPIPADLSVQRTTPPRILMVEDNPIAQKIEETLFTALNCQVDLADCGERALQLFMPNKYDLVLMDIGLEDTSGYVVTKKIRQIEKEAHHHDVPRVPIIALTAYQANIVKYDCTAYFMDGVITKPLTGEQAHQLLQRFVYKKETEVKGLQTE